MTITPTARTAVTITGSALMTIALVALVGGVTIALTGNEAAFLLVLVALAFFTTAIGTLTVARRL